MSFENFPSAETPTTPQPPPIEPPKSNMRSFIVVSLIIALLATWGYIIYDKSRNKEIEQQKQSQIDNLDSAKNTLQNELNDATSRYDELKTTNAEKDSTISSKDKEIAETKAKIQSLLSKKNATSSELAQAKTLIASLNHTIDDYKTQVATLQAANAQLTTEKAQVSQQLDVSQHNLDSTQQVVKQKEDIIDVGSTLHASNFNILGIDAKKNGKERETTNAKKVNKLRISFDLDENMITQTGNQTLYVCITGPDGKPITGDDAGTFNTRDSQSIPFTQKIDVNYIQNKRQTVSFDWKQNTIFQIGDYKIEVYNNGFKIGEGITHLKKGGLFG